MKKTIIAILALSSLSWAASVDYSGISSDLTDSLTYAWDFSESTAPNKGGITLSGVTRTENGTIGVGKNIADPWKTSGLALGSSWTLSVDIASVALTSSQKGAILSLYSGGSSSECNNVMAIWATGSNNAITLQNKIENNQAGFGNNAEFSLSSGIAAKDMNYNTLTLVSDAATETLTLYIDGEQAAQQSDWSAAAITGYQFGSCFSGWWQLQGRADLDNIYIFNSALSADQVKGLIVPEPATATLSLLALAGLAARRRRH